MVLPLSKNEWNQTQKEVWGNVEAYTNLVLEGDLEGFSDYFHKDYMGWNYYELMPVNRSDVKKELQLLPSRKIAFHKLTPVAINIFNDVAIVHYYYSAVYKNTDGLERAKTGRNTDILLKQIDRWILIGDHVG